MLNKPIKIRKIAMLCLAQILWLSCLGLYAQNKKVSNDGSEKKKVVATPQKVSLSNQDPNKKQVDEATAKRMAADEKRVKDQALEQKKQAAAREKEAASVSKNQHPSIAAKVSPQQNVSAVKQSQPAKSQTIAQDWELKKAKIAADLKAKGYSQYDIDKHIAAMEKEMNINNK
jgi:hypothetical protein